jgi:hypothetical protein
MAFTREPSARWRPPSIFHGGGKVRAFFATAAGLILVVFRLRERHRKIRERAVPFLFAAGIAVEFVAQPSRDASSDSLRPSALGFFASVIILDHGYVLAPRLMAKLLPELIDRRQQPGGKERRRRGPRRQNRAEAEDPSAATRLRLH